MQCPPDDKKSFLSLLQDERLNGHYSVARGVTDKVVDLTNEKRFNRLQKEDLKHK